MTEIPGQEMADDILAAEQLPRALEQLSEQGGQLRLRHRHLLPDGFLISMHRDVFDQCSAVLLLTQAGVPRSATPNARAALEGAAEMLYLTAASDTYDERGAQGRVFELVALDRLATRSIPAVKRALELEVGDPPKSTEEILCNEGKVWSKEFPEAIGLVERSLKAAQSREGGNWTGLTRSELVKAAVTDWGPALKALPSAWDVLYGQLSLDSHPGPRTGRYKIRFEEGSLILEPRESDRLLVIKPVLVAAYLAMQAARRAMEFTSGPGATVPDW